MSAEREQAIEKAKTYLSKRELHAYSVWCGTEKPALASSLNMKLFQLFLQGKGTEEIRRLNPQLQLGEIVAARIEGRWDERREEHLDQLLSNASMRVQQATMETADFVCDLLAVASREHGDRLRRYLQSGDETELGDFRVTSLGSLKTAIEMLQKLTGQDQQRHLKVTGNLTTTPAAADATPSSAQAATVLKLLTAVK
jgi:hypothetical protein